MEANPNGMIVTPDRGDEIVLSVLQQWQGHDSPFDSEIQEHKIESPIPIKDMTSTVLGNLLRMNK